MKKIFSLLFIFVLLISLCGCNKNTISNNDSEFQSGLTDIPTDNTTNSAGNSEDVKDENNENNETVNGESTIENSELTEEQKAEQERMNQIADCKNYVSDIKVYFCDYSVFDYKTAVALDYILASNESTPPEKSCSVVMVVDYGNKELKEKYNPRFSFSVPNISKKEDASGTLVSMNTWSISDTVTVYFYRFNKEVPITDMTYRINIKDLDINLIKNLEDEITDFNSILSVLENSVSPIKTIDNRTYILLNKNSISNLELLTENGVSKYFVDDTYIYFPLTNGPEVLLTSTPN